MLDNCINLNLVLFACAMGSFIGGCVVTVDLVSEYFTKVKIERSIKKLVEKTYKDNIN